MEDLIHLQQDGLHNIVSDKLEVDLIKKLHNILLASCEEIV